MLKIKAFEINILGILIIFCILPKELIYSNMSDKKIGEITKDNIQSSLKFGRISEEKDIMLDSLPNGIALIPDFNETPLSIFSFLISPNIQMNSYYRTTDSNNSDPIEKISEKLRKNRMGDLMYNFNENAEITVSSLQVQSFGEGSLSNLRETVIEPNLETFHRIPARLGLRYMIKTVDGKYGLFRIIALKKRAIMIQWIYQPDGSTIFKGTGNFLDRYISYSWDGDLTMNIALMHLRRLGIRVCFETAVANSKEDTQQVIKDINNVNIRIMLDGLLKKTNRYNWEAIEGTNIICIYPRINSFLNKTVKKSDLKLPISNRPWISIIESINLDTYKIRYPYWKGLSVFIGIIGTDPPNKNLSIILNSDFSIKQILAKICWEYGDGMYFTLGRLEEGTKGLFFETNPSQHELKFLEDKEKP
jgi:hypothetical protein